MLRFLALGALVLVLAVSAASANRGFSSTAGSPTWGFSRSYTSAPADSSPNTSAPSAGNIFEIPDYYYCGSGTAGACVATMGFALYLFHDGTGANISCTVTPWVRDGSSARWYSLASTTGVESYEGFENVTVGPVDVFFQVASCGGGVTVSGAHPVTLYAGPK
jgi:hypothetical protein